MGIYSDGEIYGIYIKTPDLEKELKITSQEPLTKEQILGFFSENSKLIDKSDTSLYFLESVSTTLINIPNKSYIWVPRAKDYFEGQYDKSESYE